MMCFKLWTVNCNKCENKSLLQKIAWTENFLQSFFDIFLLVEHSSILYTCLCSLPTAILLCIYFQKNTWSSFALPQKLILCGGACPQTSGGSSWIVSSVLHAASHLLHDLFRTLFVCFAHELCRKTVCRWWKQGALTIYVCSYTCEKYSACIEYNIWQFFTPQ